MPVGAKSVFVFLPAQDPSLPGGVASIQSVFPPPITLSRSTLVDTLWRCDSKTCQVEDGNIPTPSLVKPLINSPLNHNLLPRPLRSQCLLIFYRRSHDLISAIVHSEF